MQTQSSATYAEVGTVEVLIARTYPLDPEATEGGTDVIVFPGTFPLFSDGLTRFWMMRGELSDGLVRRRGDGMFTMTPADVPTGIEVVFPSRRFGPDEWDDLTSHDVCREGAPGQRLRVAEDTEA